MADEIRLVTFEGENVAPINDALMWDVAIGDSGVIYGCETTIKNASTLHIEAGYGVICGRHFQIFESDVPVTLSPGGDLLGRLYIHMDLSDASEPVQLLVETDASLTPEEQDANINIINGIWDMNLATFALNAVTISNLQNVFSTVAGGGSNLIAGTETGATASQAYVKGQYIIWGGRLWEVTAAIAQGDQFVIGSNLSASSTTVGNELTGLNSRLTNVEEGQVSSKCVVKGALFWTGAYNSIPMQGVFIANTDGTTYSTYNSDISSNLNYVITNCDFISNVVRSANYQLTFTVSQDGYYYYNSFDGSRDDVFSPTFLSAGQNIVIQIDGYRWPAILTYCGMSVS